MASARQYVDQLEMARRHVDQLVALYNFSMPIANGMVKEFFVENHWANAVPESWREPLEELPLEELSELLTSGVPVDTRKVWPLSLLAFVASCHALRLPGQFDPRGEAGEEGVARPARADADGRCSEEAAVDTELRRSVNPKKMHEIMRLSAMADQLRRAVGCHTAVDVGSGLGYFSRTLAFELDWDTIGVEAVEANVVAARQLDTYMVPRLRAKRGADWAPGSLRHVTAWLPPTMTAAQFLTLLAPPPDDASEGNASSATDEGAAAPPDGGTSRPPNAAPRNTALLGLHTCGDLACTLLRIYNKAGPAIGCIVNVGCCYMHMSEVGCEAPSAPRQVGAQDWAGAEARRAEAGASADPRLLVCQETQDSRPRLPGFPLSRHVGSRGVRLGYHVREMACHSTAAYVERLREAARKGEAGERTLQLHGRRAVLEILLQRRSGYTELKRAKCGSIRGAAHMSFEEYCDQCFARVGMAPLTEEERLEIETDLAPLFSQWRRVVVFFALRQLLAPLWEALLLLDRLLFLAEEGHHAALFPVFDPTLSPRNYALVGVRPSARVTAEVVAAALPPHAIAILQADAVRAPAGVARTETDS